MGLPSSLKPCVLLLFLCLLGVCTSKPAPLTQEPVLFRGNFPALYVFGDSLVDSGNNNHLETQAKSNYPPYGVDFEGGVATGRTGNGKTIADYIAIYYGLPLVPPYLGLSEEERNNISTGINYASASCGVFPESGSAAGHCLSMPVQVALFRETKEKNLKKIFKTEAELTKHLANSLFFTAIGVNDYNSAFNETTDDPNEFADKLLHAFLVQIQRLHWLGARKFFINNIKPLGCYPNIVAHTTPRGSCNHGLNRAVAIYNAKLRASLPHIMRKLSGTSFLHSDYFNFMLGLRGPSRNANSNLVDMTTPCCPDKYNGNMFCTPGSSSCKVPDDTHIFFDPFHPTQLANFMYAMACFHEREVCHVVRG